MGTSIGDDFLRETMMFPHMVYEKVCSSSSRDHCDSENKICMLGDGINDNHDGIMPCRLWQLDNKVHADGVTGVTSLHSHSVLGRDSNKELSSI